MRRRGRRLCGGVGRRLGGVLVLHTRKIREGERGGDERRGAEEEGGLPHLGFQLLSPFSPSNLRELLFRVPVVGSKFLCTIFY
jgi:hypothetical protein